MPPKSFAKILGEIIEQRALNLLRGLRPQIQNKLLALCDGQKLLQRGSSESGKERFAQPIQHCHRAGNKPRQLGDEINPEARLLRRALFNAQDAKRKVEARGGCIELLTDFVNGRGRILHKTAPAGCSIEIQKRLRHLVRDVIAQFFQEPGLTCAANSVKHQHG